jgi:cyclohexanone monooxygenase
VCAESIVEWITDTIGYIRKNGYSRIAPTVKAEDAWVDHANDVGSRTMLSGANSWFIGANIPGKAHAILLYASPAPVYRAHCTEAAANGYKDFVLE